MREKLTAVCILILPFIMSGCSLTDTWQEKSEEWILKQSGIEEDSEYQTYREYDASGKLNGDGEYYDPELEEYYAYVEEKYSEPEDEQVKQVHITFAQNEFLKVHYYTDANLTQEIDGTSVYIDPGEKIYCSQPAVENGNSSSYVFKEFQIYEFDDDGTKGNLYATAGEQSLILDLPDDYEGTQLSVLPIGEYEKKGLQLEAYFINANGSKQTVTGNWYVNGELYNADTDQVGATDDYTVKFEYDYDTYYYLSATPEPFSNTNDENQVGTVEFKNSSALNGAESYSIELHQWIAANFEDPNNKIKSINGDEDWDNDGSVYSNLKGGDTLTVITEDGYRIFSNELTIDPPEVKNGGYKYTILIPTDEYTTEYSFRVTKTDLTVSLDSSLGTDIGFDVEASGYHKSSLYYQKESKINALKGTYKAVSESVGADNNIIITMSEGSLSSNQAIRLDINKTDGNGDKTKEIKYITKSGDSAEVILQQETDNLNKMCSTVSVELSLVDVMEVSIPSVDKGSIKLVLNDSSEELENGSIVEGSRKATLTITPKTGYYVSGKKTKNNGTSFEKLMKLSDYETDISDIVKEHEIKKYYSITLDTDDGYGTVTFKLNGDTVSGTIKVREEDTLTMEYELTDSGYKIVRESDGILGSINNFRKNVVSSNKESVTIDLSDINGQTLKREDYITVSKK